MRDVEISISDGLIRKESGDGIHVKLGASPVPYAGPVLILIRNKKLRFLFAAFMRRRTKFARMLFNAVHLRQCRSDNQRL